jgi:hypothetical protein
MMEHIEQILYQTPVNPYTPVIIDPNMDCKLRSPISPNALYFVMEEDREHIHMTILLIHAQNDQSQFVISSNSVLLFPFAVTNHVVARNISTKYTHSDCCDNCDINIDNVDDYALCVTSELAET